MAIFSIRLVSILLSSLLCLSVAAACEQQATKAALANYKWLAEDYPPYNYSDESGQLVGIFTDVLARIYQTLEIPFDTKHIMITPWARLYHTIEHKEEFAAFSMVTTEERKKLFRLVPLPIVTKTSILVLAQNKKELSNKAHNELSIAVVRQDIGQQLLIDQNFPAQMVETTSAYSMLQMLAHHRVDAIAYSEDVTYFQNRKLGITDDTIEPLHVLDDKAFTNYMFHKNTPACVITLFEKTIAKLHQDGELVSIWNKYLTTRPHQ